MPEFDQNLEHVSPSALRGSDSQTPKLQELLRQRTIENTVVDLVKPCTPVQRALLSTMAVAEVHRLDQVLLLSNLSPELSTRYGEGIGFLMEAIQTGTPTIIALEGLPGLLPDTTLLSLRVGLEDGTLPLIYQQLLDREPASLNCSQSMKQSNLSKLMWLAVKAMFGLSVIGFIAFKVVPEFQKMFGMDEIELPTIVYTVFFRSPPVVLGLLCIFFLLLIPLLPIMLGEFFAFLRRWNPQAWQQSKPTAPVETRRRLSVLARATRFFQSVEILPKSLQSKFPWAEASSKASKTDPATSENRIERWNLLAKHRILSNREAKALSATTNHDTQAWLMRWFAGKREQRDASRTDSYVQMFILFVNILLTVAVLLSAVSVFATLIAIINEHVV